MSVACNWVIWNGSHVIVSFSWANFLWAPPPTLCFFLVGLFWLTLLSFVTNVETERATARVLPLLAVGGIGANSPSPPHLRPLPLVLPHPPPHPCPSFTVRVRSTFGLGADVVVAVPTSLHQKLLLPLEIYFHSSFRRQVEHLLFCFGSLFLLFVRASILFFLKSNRTRPNTRYIRFLLGTSQPK